MRAFKYWVKVTGELNVGNEKQVSTAIGGSNISEEAAAKDAEDKLRKAQQKIDGQLTSNDDYEADIVEEIVHIIDKDNVVTRNRYGALVLNSKHIMFLDIDEYSRSLYDSLFNRSLKTKELMLKRIQKLVKKKRYSGMGFRAYETARGFRVMVLNVDFAARSKISKKMMSDFDTDWMYRWMCEKQNCYRARLTPKPYRIRQKGIKVLYPERDDAEESALNKWVEEYEAKSKQFATCRLRLVSGDQAYSRVVEYHDEMTKCRSEYKLA